MSVDSHANVPTTTIHIKEINNAFIIHLSDATRMSAISLYKIMLVKNKTGGLVQENKSCGTNPDLKSRSS